MTCPRCGYDDVSGDACPRCGVVPSKYRPEHSRPILTAARHMPSSDASTARPRPARPAPNTPREADDGPRGQGSRGPWLVALMLAVLVALAVGLRRRGAAPAPAPTPVAAHDVVDAAPTTDNAPAPAVELAPFAAPSQPPQRGDLDEADFASANALASRVPERVVPGDEQLADTLLQRHPDHAQLRELLVNVLLSLAQKDLAARRFDTTRARLERAVALAPSDARPHLGLHNLYVALEDWPRAEATVRAALELDATNRPAQQALAYALFRQDRNREAREILRALLAVSDEPQARALLARIERALADEQGMTEQRLAHFHVRYDGEEHADVGREILRALERHYATLTTTLDFQPTTVVPVILFSREAYFSASGAPAWSGGVFDQIDGRIRIPIGGLDAALTPEMDGTLLHELTHAFVHERTRGQAPRELHEGLAQYLEGKRVDDLDGDVQSALATGRVGGVLGFYLEALAFTEYLVAQRGQGGINDLLRVMGENGDSDAAFRDVYGQDLATLQRAFRQRFRSQNAS